MANKRQRSITYPGLNNVYKFAEEAVDFDASVANSAGDYVIYDGDLYRITADREAGTSWANTTKTKTKSTDEIKRVEAKEDEAVGHLKSALNEVTGVTKIENWTKGKRYNTSGNSVDLVNDPETSETYDCIVVSCSEGDVFTLTGKSSNASYRLWCWCTDNGDVVDKPTMSLDYTLRKMVAPQGATKLVVNTLNTIQYTLYYGEIIPSQIEIINNELDSCNELIDEIEKNDESYIKYWSEFEFLPKNNSTSAGLISVSRKKQITEIDGVTEYNTFVKLSGSCARAATISARNNFAKEIDLENGHKYSLSAKVISGGYTPTENNNLSVALYDSSNNNLASISLADVGNTFITLDSDKTVNIVLSVPGDVTATNLKLFVALQDITEAGVSNGIYRDIYTYLDGIIDPDTFAGNDRNKIISAMNAIGNEGHGVIVIKREYNITSSIPITHYGSADARIIFLGIGNNAGFNMNSVNFYGSANDRSYGSLAFVNIIFKGTSTLFDTDYLIRINFDQCVFDGMAYVSYTTRFTQSYYYSNCLFRHITSVVIAASSENGGLVDVHFNMCIVEHGGGFIHAYSLHGIYVTNCCIEGMSGYIVNAKGDCRTLIINGNYFEANNNGYGGTEDHNGVHFNFSTTRGIIQSVVISNNKFSGQHSEDTIILLPKVLSHTNEWINITDNIGSVASPDGMYIVAAHAESTKPYDHVYLARNSLAKVNDPNHLIINMDDAGTIFSKELTSGTDLDALYNIGYHYAGENHGVLNAPTSGEFYLLNIRSDNGIAQIAVTANGIKSRINDGIWN